jgi:hypothetical protein
MSDAFWVSFFASLPGALASMGALIMGVIQFIKLQSVHQQINGRMGEIIELTARASRAEGVKQEIERPKILGDKIPSKFQ